MRRSPYQLALGALIVRSSRRRRSVFNEQRIDIGHTWYGRLALAQRHRKRKPLRVVALERGWWPAEWWPS